MYFGNACLLTRSLRICATSAPLAVVPVGGICGSARPARRLLSASSAGLTRKLRPRRSGASMPCVHGWLVRSASNGGGDEGASGIHAGVSRQENFAVYVNKIMPRCWDLLIASAVPFWAIGQSARIKSSGHYRFGLTAESMWSIIIFTYTSSYAQE